VHSLAPDADEAAAVRARASDACARALAFARAAGYASWDPFDIWSVRPWRTLAPPPKTLARRVARSVARRAAERRPVLLRRLLRIPHRRLAPALADLAIAHALRGEAEQADELLAVLQETSVPGGGGWGLPFRQGPPIPIDAATPAVTIAVKAYRAFALREDAAACLAVAERTARTEPLPGAAGICFPYVPGSTLHIHNANLAAAEILADAAVRFDRHEWAALADRSAAYWLDDWKRGGEFEYAGPEDRERSQVDHLHAALVVRSAAALARHVPAVAERLPEVRRAYVDGFFEGDLPSAPGDRGWTDTQAVAEAVQALLALGERARAFAVGRALLGSLAVGDTFASRMRRSDGALDRTPYLRWAHAPATAALAALEAAA
jgi:hypothetical protein